MDTRSRTILVTGANGFIGRRVVEAALAAGHEVRTLSRRDWLGAPHVPLENRFLGALPFAIPEKAFEGLYAVVHLANTTGGESDATARAINVEGTRRLFDLAERADARKFVYISSQSARPDAVSAYGKTKLEAEGVFRSGSLPYTILRPGLVYGPGTRDIFNRMVGLVRKLPVLPLLGGGRAVVQPIHVDDLAEAILRCLDPVTFNARILKLGDPRPIPLRDFLQKIAVVLTGKRKPAVSIPVGPIIQVATISESLGVKLPVSKNNLQGLQKVEAMETAESLRDLGLTLRPLGEGLRQSLRRGGGGAHAAAASSAAPVGLDRRAVGVALIGAGRIGMMHALTIERQRGMRLAALVDKNPKQNKFLEGVGIAAPGYSSLDEALAHQPLDAAIIATPPRFHLPIFKECAARGIPVLIEKPLARSAKELERFRALAERVPAQAGYLAPSYPQFREALGRLREGRFGPVLGFEAFSLQSLFPGPKRWETDPKTAGGGVLINLGGHVLTWLFEAFGLPRRFQAQHKSVTSRRVEDSMVLHFDFEGFSGRYCTSWTIGGFPQAENRLVVHTGEGRLLLTNTVAAFLDPDGRVVWFRHQVDFEDGYNFAPDYIGGAVAAELNQFQRLVRTGEPPVMPLRRGIEFETFLFSIYKQSRKVPRFEPAGSETKPAEGETFGERKEKATEKTPAVSGGVAAGDSSDGRARVATAAATATATARIRPRSLVLDMRQTPVDAAVRRKMRGLAERWDGFQATASQVQRLRRAGVDSSAIVVVAPDFMNYARQINSGHAVAFLKSLGARSVAAMGMRAVRAVAAQKGVTFWAVAQSLLAADLALLPRGFDGTVLLHSFLTDMTVTLTRGDLLETLVGQIRASARDAAAGIQTNILQETLDALVYMTEPPKAVHFLSSPGSHTVKSAVARLRAHERFLRCRLVAEVGAVPSVLHDRILSAAREKTPDEAWDWANGADALVVDAGCEGELAASRRRTVERAWQAAFPGVPLPPGVL